MLVGSLLAGASCVNNPFVPVGAVLAKKSRARRVYRASPNSVWMTGFVVVGSARPVSAGSPRARSNSYKSLRVTEHTSSSRAVLPEPGCDACQLSCAEEQSKGCQQDVDEHTSPPQAPSPTRAGGLPTASNRSTHSYATLPLLPLCLSGSAVSADRPLPDTRPACQLWRLHPPALASSQTEPAKAAPETASRPQFLTEERCEALTRPAPMPCLRPCSPPTHSPHTPANANRYSRAQSLQAPPPWTPSVPVARLYLSPLAASPQDSPHTQTQPTIEGQAASC